MSCVTLRVWRPWTDSFGDLEGRLALHLARAEMLHGMARELSLDVVSWGETDATYPREWVDFVVAVTSQLTAEAIASAVRHWFQGRKVKDVEIVSPKDSYSIGGLNAEEMAKLGQYLWELRSTEAPSPAGAALAQP